MNALKSFLFGFGASSVFLGLLLAVTLNLILGYIALVVLAILMVSGL